MVEDGQGRCGLDDRPQGFALMLENPVPECVGARAPRNTFVRVVGRHTFFRQPCMARHALRLNAGRFAFKRGLSKKTPEERKKRPFFSAHIVENDVFNKCQ